MTTHPAAIAFAGAGAVTFAFGTIEAPLTAGAILPTTEVITVTIASGQSLSTGARLGAGSLRGLDLPTLDAAALTFQASVDGTTYREALDAAGDPVEVAETTGGQLHTAPAELDGVPYLKVRSGTAGAPVNQSADRTISLVVSH